MLPIRSGFGEQSLRPIRAIRIPLTRSTIRRVREIYTAPTVRATRMAKAGASKGDSIIAEFLPRNHKTPYPVQLFYYSHLFVRGPPFAFQFRFTQKCQVLSEGYRRVARRCAHCSPSFMACVIASVIASVMARVMDRIKPSSPPRNHHVPIAPSTLSRSCSR